MSSNRIDPEDVLPNDVDTDTDDHDEDDAGNGTGLRDSAETLETIALQGMIQRAANGQPVAGADVPPVPPDAAPPPVVLGAPTPGETADALGIRLPMRQFPSDNPMDHHAVNEFLTFQYFSAQTANDRQTALRGLQQQVSEGRNLSAVHVLQQLTLVDAVHDYQQGLIGQNLEVQAAALRRIARLAAGDPQGAAAQFLTRLEGSGQMQQVADARAAAAGPGPGRAGAGDAGQLLGNFLGAGTAAERAQALAEIQGLNPSENRGNFQPMQHWASAADATLTVGESTTPAQALQSLERLEQLAQTNEHARAYLARIPNIEQLKQMLGDPATAAVGLQNLVDSIAPLRQQIRDAKPEEIMTGVEAELAAGDSVAFQAMAGLLDRTATPQQRTEALERLERANNQRIGEFGRLDEQGPVQWARAFNQLNLLKEATTPAQAAAVLRTLDTLARQGMNTRAASALNAVAPEFEQTVAALERGDQAALRQVQERLGAVTTELSTERVTFLTQGLGPQTSAADLAKAAEILKQEVEAGNEAARDPLKWVEVGRAMVGLRDGNGTAESARTAVEALNKLASEGNPHARTALASLLAASRGEPSATQWRGTLPSERGQLVPWTSNVMEQLKETDRITYMDLLSSIRQNFESLRPQLTEQEQAALQSSMGDTRVWRNDRRQVTEVYHGDQRWKIDYGPDGKISRVTYPDGLSRTTTDGGRTWREGRNEHNAGNRTWTGTIEVGADGTIRETDSTTHKVRTVYPGGESLTRDENGRLVRHDRPDGSWDRYTLNEAGERIGRQARATDGVITTYDGGGNASEIRLPAGGWLRVDRDEQGHVTRLTNDRGQIITSTDGGQTFASGNIRFSGQPDIDARGTVRWRGDNGPEVLQRLDGSGSITLNGVEHLTSNADGSIVSRDANNRVAETVDSQGRRTTFTRGDDGQLIAISKSDGTVWNRGENGVWTKQGSNETRHGEFSVEQDGSIVFTDDTCGQTINRLDGSTIRLNESGRPTELVNARGQRSAITYGADNLPARVAFPDGTVLRAGANNTWFDERTGQQWQGTVEVRDDGSMVRRAADGTVTTNAGDGSVSVANGDIVRTTRYNANGSSVTTDQLGQIVETTDAQGRSTTYDRNRDGQISLIEDSSGTWSSRDGVNFGLSESDEGFAGRVDVRPDGTRIDRLTNGNVRESRTDGSVFEKDSAGRVVFMRTVAQAVPPDAPFGLGATPVEIRFGYDAQGRLNKVVDASGEWTSEDGTTWKHRIPDDNFAPGDVQPDFQGTMTVGADGQFVRTATGTGEVTTISLNGDTVVRDREGRVLRENRADRSYTDNSYNAEGALLTSRQRRSDGTYVETGPHGVSEFRTPDGRGRVIERNADGRITQLKEWDGAVWQSTDGRTFRNSATGVTIEGTPSVGADGSVTFTLSDRSTVLLKTDGSREQRDAAGKLRQTISPEGTVVGLDDVGRVTETLSPSGQRRVLGYDSNGRLSSVQEPDGSMWSSTDGVTWRKLGTSQTVQGERSVSADGRYRVAEGQNVTTHNADGSAFTTNGRGNVTEVVDRTGRKTIAVYDEAGNLSRITLPDGRTLVSTENGRRWQVQGTDRVINASFRIEADGRVVQNLHESRETRIARLDGWTDVVEESGLRPRRTSEFINTDGARLVRNERGQLTQVLDANGTARAYRFDEQNRIVQVNDGTWNPRASYPYVRWSAPWSSTDGQQWRAGDQRWNGTVSVAGDGTQTSRGTEGDLTIRRAEGTLISSDAQNRVTGIRRTDGTVISAQYNESGMTELKEGNKVWTTSDGGQTWRSGNETFNGQFRLTSDGNLERVQGNRVTSTDRYGNQTVLENGRPVSMRRSDGTEVTYRYNEQSALVSSTERTPGRVEITKDANGKITRVAQPDGSWRQFDRGPDGSVTRITESGGVSLVSSDGGRTFRMNGAGEPLVGQVIVNADGTYALRAGDGFTLTRKLNGELEGRDNENRLRSRTFADGRQLSFDEQGRVTETVDAAGNRRAYGYRDGNLVSITEPGGAVYVSENGTNWRQISGPRVEGQTERTGAYQVGADGSLTFSRADRAQFITRLDGSTVEKDAQGRVSCVRDRDGKVHTIEYGADNNPSRIRYPNGDTWTRGTDGVWLKQGTNERWSATVRVDANGNIREESNGRTVTRRTDGWIETVDNNGTRLQRQNTDGSWVSKNAAGQVTTTWDSRNRQRDLGYDAAGRLVRISDASGVWTSTDGENWTKQGTPPETSRMRVEVGEDGALRMLDLTTNKTTVKGTDGSTIVTNAAGQVLEVNTGTGVLREFGYAADGSLNRIKQPDGSVWTTTDGQNWTRQGTNETRRFRAEVSREGSFVETDLTTNMRKTHFASGRVLEMDSSNRVRYDARPDGSYTRWGYDNTGKITEVERRNPDGTVLWTNDKDQIVRVRTVTGVERRFGYDAEGRMNFAHDEEGIWRREGNNQWRQEGRSVVFVGQRGVMRDGGYLTYNQETSERTLRTTDGKRVVQTERPVPSVVAYDAQNRVTETVNQSNVRRQYGYDAQGNLNRFVEFDAEGRQKVWTSTDNRTWRSGNETMNCRLALVADGTLTRVFNDNGRQLIERLREAPIQVDPADTAARAQAIYNAIFPGEQVIETIENPTGIGPVDWGLRNIPLVPGLPPPARVLRVTQQLSKDWEAVVNILNNMSEPEREALRQEYQRRYGTSMESHFRTFNAEAQSERALNALNRRDGSPDLAGNIHASLTERGQYIFGRSTGTCEKEIRDIIGRLSSNDIARLREQYQARYGQNLDDVLLRGDMSERSKQALRILMQGTDAIRNNPQLTLQLADLALANRDVQMFEEAFRFASPQAREQFKNNNGEQRMRDAFGGSWVNLAWYLVPGGPAAGQLLNFNTNVTDTDLRHAMDYAEYGRLSAATQVTDNTSWLGDNEKAIENALFNMRPEERQSYLIGRALTRGETPQSITERFPDFARMSDADKDRARQYYQSLYNALNRAAGAWFSPQSQAAELAKWEDMVAVRGGTILSRLASHSGCIYNSSNQEIFNSVENMTRAEWEYLHGLPPAERERKLAEIEQTLAGFMGRTLACPEALGITAQAVTAYQGREGAALARRAVELLREKANAGSFEVAQGIGRRSVMESLQQNTSFFGNNYNALAESIAHMPAAERAQYYSTTSSAYRDRLNRMIEDAVPAGPARDLIMGMLSRGSVQNAPKFDPLDRLNLRILEDDKQRREVNLGAVAVSSINPLMLPYAVTGAVTGDNTVQTGVRAAGLITNFPGEAARDLFDMFRNRESYNEFKRRYDSDATYRANFDAAARRLFPNSSEYNKYIVPLIQTGTLPPETLVQLREGLVSDDNSGFQRDFAAMTQDERNRLLNDDAARQAAFRSLNAREQQVAMNILRQGSAAPEDLARACVIGFGTTKEEVIARWQALSAADRNRAIVAYSQKYGSSIISDLRAKLGPTEAENILDRPGTPEEALDRILQRYYRSYDGVGAAMVDTLWDGTGIQARDAANQLVAMQAEATAQFERMKDDPRFRDAVQSLITALKDFKDSKEAMANAVVDAVIAIAAVGGAVFTGGVSLSLLACTAIAGAALKVAIKAGIMGADYNWRSADPLIDALTGAFDAATSFLGPGEIAALCRVGENAAMAASRTAVRQLGGRALREGAEQVLQTELTQLMRNSIVSGAKHIPDDVIEAMARRVAREGADAATVREIAQLLKTELNQQLQTEMRSVLRNLTREYLLVMSSGAAGGGVSGTIRGAAEWDPNLTVRQNLDRLAMTAGTSTVIGGLGAGAFHTAFRGGSALYERFRANRGTPDLPGAPRPGDGPSPRPGEQPAPRPGEQPAPRPGEQPQPRPGEQPAPRPGEQPVPRPQERPVRPDGSPEVHEARGPVPPEALGRSNEFSNTHALDDRIPDGFTTAGAGTEIRANGAFEGPRAAVVVDRQADAVLQSTVNEARDHLAQLARQRGQMTPQQQMEALADFVRSKFKHGGGTPEADRLLNDMYATFMADNAGRRVHLGDFINRGMGGCAEQSLLLKVLADDLIPGARVSLVRGNGTGSGDVINHMWTTMQTPDGRTLVFDPRQGHLGRPYSDFPDHYRPGSQMGQADGARTFTPGEQVEYHGGGWRVVRETPEGDVVLQHDGARVLSRQQADNLAELNPEVANNGLRVGQELRIRRPDGSVEDGWRVQGYTRDGDVILVKQNAVEVRVPKADLVRNMPELAGDPHAGTVTKLRALDATIGNRLPAQEKAALMTALEQELRGMDPARADRLLNQLQAKARDADFPQRIEAIRDAVIAGRTGRAPVDLGALMHPHVSLAQIQDYAKLAQHLRDLDTSLAHVDEPVREQIRGSMEKRMRQFNAEADAVPPAHIVGSPPRARDVERYYQERLDFARAKVAEIAEFADAVKANPRMDAALIENIADVLERTHHRSDLILPTRQLLHPDAVPENVTAYLEFFRQSSHSDPPLNDLGFQYERDAGAALQRALATNDGRVLPEGWVFVPSNHNSPADAVGIDGVFMNLRSSPPEVVPVDFARTGTGYWSSNNPKALQGKIDKGEAQWALHIPEGDLPHNAQTLDAVRNFLARGAQGTPPPRINLRNFNGQIGSEAGQTGLFFPSFRHVSTATEAGDLGALHAADELRTFLANANNPRYPLPDDQATREAYAIFVDRAGRPGGPVTWRQHEVSLARQLSPGIGHATDALANLRHGGGDVLGGGTATLGHEVVHNRRRNFLDIQPKRGEFQMEVWNNASKRNETVSVSSFRVYEDGSVIAVVGDKNVDLGNIRDLIKRNPGSSGPESRAIGDNAVNQLRGNQPFDFSGRVTGDQLMRDFDALAILSAATHDPAAVSRHATNSQANIQLRREIETAVRSNQLPPLTPGEQQALVGRVAAARRPVSEGGLGNPPLTFREALELDAIMRNVPELRGNIQHANELRQIMSDPAMADIGNDAVRAQTAQRVRQLQQERSGLTVAQARVQADRLGANFDVRAEVLEIEAALRIGQPGGTTMADPQILALARDLKTARAELGTVTVPQVRELQALRATTPELGAADWSTLKSVNTVLKDMRKTWPATTESDAFMVDQLERAIGKSRLADRQEALTLARTLGSTADVAAASRRLQQLQGHLAGVAPPATPSQLLRVYRAERAFGALPRPADMLSVVRGMGTTDAEFADALSRMTTIRGARPALSVPELLAVSSDIGHVTSVRPGTQFNDALALAEEMNAVRVAQAKPNLSPADALKVTDSIKAVNQAAIDAALPLSAVELAQAQDLVRRGADVETAILTIVDAR